MEETGSENPRNSFEFMPQLNQTVVDNASQLVPREALPTKEDTPQSLAERVNSSQAFDPLQALAGGNGKGKRKRVLVNETTFSQPRRRNFSMVAEDVHLDEDGDEVRTMYAYGKPNSRIRTDVTATPMPWPIFDLGAQCFLSVRHVLTEVCASSPPNHCQMLGYYALFNSKCGRHKDDHDVRDFHQVRLGNMTDEDAVKKTLGAMVPGSDVLIYSTGPLPVLFSWCYTRHGRHFMKREDYEIHPYMQLNLGHGSLFVFKAIDDLYFYHEVGIHNICAKPWQHRIAFVFRWLGAEQQADFRV